MSYFGRFPVVADYDVQGRSLFGQNITIRTGIPAAIRNDPNLYFDHTISDDETPIILADRVYDDPNKYWIILMFNNIMSMEDGWPLTPDQLLLYVSKKYSDPYGVHHYESLLSQLIVDSTVNVNLRKAITNLDYESGLNETKRNIRIPVPEIVGTIDAQHQELVSG